MAGVYITDDFSFATLGYAQVTVTAAAQTLAQLLGTSIPAGAMAVYVTPETGSIRMRADGVAPTTSVGQPIQQLQSWPVSGAAALDAMQIIASTATIVSFEFRG
jgi:hypothetical protein